MNKHYAAVAIAVICSAGLAGAQSAKNTAAAADTGKTASGTLVVIGCVARSPDAKGYVLNEAIMAPRPVDKTASELRPRHRVATRPSCPTCSRAAR